MGVIDIQWSTSEPTVTLLENRKPDDQLAISSKDYSSRKNNAKRRLDSVIAYLTEPNCRNEQLLTYFGQKSDPCGICDLCLTQKQIGSKFNLKKRCLFVLRQTFIHGGNFPSFRRKRNRSKKVLERIVVRWQVN